jgi:hypothetical protein
MKTEYDRERAKLVKAVRSTIRLKHSLNADDELADVLPRILQDYDRAIASGQAYELASLSLLSEMEDAD